MSELNMLGKIEHNYSIKNHNSWHVGGTVKRVYWPNSLQGLKSFLAGTAKNDRIIYLGLGSNVLFPDEMLDATVIILNKTLGNITCLEEGMYRAEAGVSCAKFAKRLCRDGYSDGTFFAGIPGSIGGALRMNAGAFGGVTWPHVTKVEYLDLEGKLHIFGPNKFTISYRHVVLPMPGCFVAADFKFVEHSSEDPKSIISTLLSKRSETQPIGSFNCGSVFKNPEGMHAAALIDACGLKGLRIGDAEISTKHANFIINLGSATASDIISLMQVVIDKVAAKFNVSLETEVQIIYN